MAEHVARMTDHWWWRPGWGGGTRFYTWHLTFEGAPEVHRLAADYRRALAGVPGLDLIPDQWLHLTMQGVGFAQAVSEADLGAIVDAAGARLAGVPAFDVDLGSAIVTPEALLLQVRPDGPVRAVRDAIRGGIGEVWSVVPEAADGFTPHVSVAYSNADGSAGPAVAALDSVVSGPARARISSAELIVLHRDNRMYEWIPYRSVPLG